MDFQDFDLLGDPVDPNTGRRGRRTHVVNDTKRRLVVALCALGKSTDEIAAALDCSAPTLRKHYRRELVDRLDARERAEAFVVSNLIAQVEAGNVAAIKEFQMRLDRADLRFSLADQAEAAEKKQEKLGKKEAAKVAARTAHEKTPWETLVN